MANIIITHRTQLNTTVVTESLPGLLYAGENDAHVFIVSAVRGDAPVTLSGAVTGLFIRPDESTVALSGEIVNGCASVTLPQSCYTQTGRFQLTVYVTENGVKTAVYCLTGNVKKTSTETIIDPGHVVPDVDDIIAEYATMQQAVEDCEDAAEAANTAATAADAAAANVAGAIADAYSATSTYAVGDYCTKDGKLYRCVTAISTAEVWTAAHWTEVQTMEEVGDLKSATDTLMETVMPVYDYESGWTIAANGTVSMADGVCLSNYISVTPAVSTTVYCGTTTDTLQAVIYNSEKTRIDNWGIPNGTRTFNMNQAAAYMRFAFKDGADAYVSQNGVTIWRANDVLNPGNLVTDVATLTGRVDVIDATVYPQQITETDLEQGEFSGGAGKRDNTKRIRLINPVRAIKGQVLRFAVGDLYWLAWELSSSATTGGNVIVNTSWNQNKKYVVQNDCWIMMAFATAATESASSAITVDAFDGHTVDISATADIVDIKEGLIQAQSELAVLPQIEGAIYPCYITGDMLEQGEFSGSNGKRANTKRIRLITPLRMAKGQTLSFSIGSLYRLVWELSSVSTAGGNVITGNGWNQDTTYTIQNDCWLMMAFATAQTESASSAITVSDFDGKYVRAVGDDVVDLESLYSGYHALTDTAKQAKIEAFAALMKGKTDIMPFLFFTDSHWLNDQNWQDEVSHALVELGGVYSTAPLDFCLYGGDAISGTSPYNQMTAAKAMYYLSTFGQMCEDTFGRETFLPLVGNHDYNYQASDLLSETDLVHAWYRSRGKAYYSHKDGDTTVYCLNTGLNRINSGTGSYDVPMDAYKWEQIDWLGKALIEDDPKHAMIAMHIIINNSVLTEFCLYTEANAVCAAYNAHTTITKNGITYDFTGCTGKVEMFIGGHLHTDDTYEIEYGIKNGIPYALRATAKNTIDPTYDLVMCDWTGHLATFKRFGTGSDLTLDLTTGQPVT